DEDERGTAGPLHLEPLVEAATLGPERARRDAHERNVAGASTVGPSTELIHLPHQLGVEPEARVEREPPPVHASEPDPAGRPERNALSGLRWIPREAERSREHARSTPGDEPERHVAGDPVQY